MEVQSAHDLQINESQFSEVHGDQNIHHYDHSLQMDGQNNTAIIHGEYRGMLDNRIINDNCSDMVIYGQGQNCQVTLDAIELPFYRNRIRNRQGMSPYPSSPLRNADQTYVLTVEGQNNTGTALPSGAVYNRSHHYTISNNTDPMTIIGQSENSQVRSDGVVVESSSSPFGNQNTRTEDEMPSTVTHGIATDLMVSSAGSDPSAITASNAHVVEHSNTDNGTTVLPILTSVLGSPTSSTASLLITAITPLNPVSAPTPPALSPAATTATLDSLNVNTADVFTSSLTAKAAEQAQESAFQPDVAGITTEATNLEPANLNATMAGPIPPSIGRVSPSPEIRNAQKYQTPQPTGSDASVPKPPSKVDLPTTNEILTPDIAPMTNTSPRTGMITLLTDAPPETEGINQQTHSTTGTPKSSKRRKNIFRILQQRVLRMWKGWKNGKEKASKV